MIGKSTIAGLVRKAVSFILNAIAGCLTVAALIVLGIIARDIWNGATAAGQISTAIITGSGIIAAAVYVAAGRVQHRVVLACDQIDSLEVREGAGHVTVVAPSATQIHHTRVVQPEAAGGAS